MKLTIFKLFRGYYYNPWNALSNELSSIEVNIHSTRFRAVWAPTLWGCDLNLDGFSLLEHHCIANLITWELQNSKKNFKFGR